MKTMKIDVTNTDPKYWEKVLESFGLGVRQLRITDSDEDRDEDTVALEEILYSE